jgi:hypothetical protein
MGRVIVEKNGIYYLVFFVHGVLFGIIGAEIAPIALSHQFDAATTAGIFGGALFGLVFAVSFYYLTRLDVDRAADVMIRRLNGMSEELVIKTFDQAMAKTSSIWFPPVLKALETVIKKYRK